MASKEDILSSCVNRLSTPGFANEAEASLSLSHSSSQLHSAIDRLMADTTSLCLDAIKRRTKMLHDQADEAYRKEMGRVKELKPWLEKRDQLLALCHQVSKKDDVAKELENCTKEVSRHEMNVPCHLLSLDDSEMSITSQKLVDLVMKMGRIQVGTEPQLEESFSDCISIGATSSISGGSPNKQVNYAEKLKPSKTFGAKNSSGPEMDKFNSPRGCALLPGGLVAVADGYNNRVKLIDVINMKEHQNLSFNIERAKTISSKQLTFTGLAVDHLNSRLLMADAERGCIFVIDISKIGASSNSNQLNHWPIVASLGTQGFQPKQFNVPMGICLDPRGEHLFVCDSKNHQVKIWNLKTNQYEQTLGDYGSKIGQFVEPSYCALTELDLSGALLLAISDSGNNRIQLFKVEPNQDVLKILPVQVVGKEGSSLGQLSNPRAVAFDNGCLLVADAGNKRMQVFAKDGTPMCSFAAGIGLIPEGLVPLEGNNVLVTDRKQHLVHIF